MPPGKTKAPWVLTIESAHWGEDKGVPGEITQTILDAGYAAVHPWHHLAPPTKIPGQVGNGQYPAQTDDLIMAVIHARNDPRCDGRVGAVGGSGGANLAAFLQAKGLVFAAVAFSPATYLPDLIVAGGYPAEKAINYAPTDTARVAASPLTYLQAGVSTPVLLVAFATDQMPANQFTDYDKGLIAAGIEHQSILLPGSGHSWSARSKVDWMGFLKSHLPPLGSPTPSPSPTVSPSPSPSSSPSPTSTPSQGKVMGVIELAGGGGTGSGAKYPAIKGERFRGQWSDAEPTEGQYNFKSLDTFIAMAKAKPGVYGMSYIGGEHYPAWLESTAAKFITFEGGKVALPWDAIVVEKWEKFMRAVKAHCLEKGFVPGYVVAGNIGKGLTTELTGTDEESAAADALGGLPAYAKNADAMMAFYHQEFTCPIIIAAAGAPYTDKSGVGGASVVLEDFVNRSMALYPTAGIMHTALRGTLGKEGLPIKLLRQYATTSHPTGLQFINSVNDPLPPPTPAVCQLASPTCFADAMAVAVGIGVTFVEIYKNDDTDENQAIIAQTDAQLRALE